MMQMCVGRFQMAILMLLSGLLMPFNGLISDTDKTTQKQNIMYDPRLHYE